MSFLTECSKLIVVAICQLYGHFCYDQPIHIKSLMRPHFYIQWLLTSFTANQNWHCSLQCAKIDTNPNWDLCRLELKANLWLITNLFEFKLIHDWQFLLLVQLFHWTSCQNCDSQVIFQNLALMNFQVEHMDPHNLQGSFKKYLVQTMQIITSCILMAK